MAASDYDWAATRNEIIQRAFRIIGVLSPGQTLSGPKLNQGIDALNSVVKEWQARKVFLWTLTPITKVLTAGTFTFDLPTNPAIMWIDRCQWRRAVDDDIPMEVISYREYNDIPDLTETGDPLQIAIDYQDVPTAYVWPVPAVEVTLYYVGVAKLQDMDSSSGTPDLPVRFTEALVYTLASRLADEYSLPISERELLTAKAENFFQTAIRSDVPRADKRFIRSAY